MTKTEKLSELYYKSKVIESNLNDIEKRIQDAQQRISKILEK